MSAVGDFHELAEIRPLMRWLILPTPARLCEMKISDIPILALQVTSADCDLCMDRTSQGGDRSSPLDDKLGSLIIAGGRIADALELPAGEFVGIAVDLLGSSRPSHISPHALADLACG